VRIVAFLLIPDAALMARSCRQGVGGPARWRFQGPEPTREAEQLFGYDRDRHERPGQVRYASRQRARIQAARRGASY
jgi:hypothetical protein